MSLTIKHAKTNSITDWTQAQLDAIIAGGAAPLPPAGTLLANITLPSDWNTALTYTGFLEATAVGAAGSDTQIQFNNAGVMGAISTYTFNNVTGQLTNSTAGAASLSAHLFTGTPFAGTGTTSFPLLYFDNGVTKPTTLSANGTYLGVNAVSGFGGNFIDLRINGAASLLVFSSAGNLSITGSLQAGTASSNVLGWTSRSRMNSPTDGTIVMTNNGTTGFTSLVLGPTVAAPAAVTLQTGSVIAGTSNTAGAAFTIAGSQGTGTGVGGSLIFQTSAAGSTGTAQNALVTALTLDSTQKATFGGNILMGTNGTLSNGTVTQAFSGAAINYSGFTNNNASCVTYAMGTQTQANGADHEDFKITSTFAPTSGASPFYGISLAYTINQTGTASGGYTAFRVNVTETAVLGTSKFLMDLQVGGASKFSVASTGGTTVNSLSISTASNGVAWSSRSKIFSPADGVIELTNAAITGFTRLQLGGTTSSFPAIKVNGTALNFRLADDSADSGITASTLGLSSNIPTYNNVATAGWGVPAIYGRGRSTAQTAAVASVATYTVGAADGSFQVSANINVTTSTTFSIQATVSYTDETNTAQTLVFPFTTLAGAFVATVTNVQGVGPYESPVLHIRAKASTAITIATIGTFTSVTYNVEGTIAQTA